MCDVRKSDPTCYFIFFKHTPLPTSRQRHMWMILSSPYLPPRSWLFTDSPAVPPFLSSISFSSCICNPQRYTEAGMAAALKKELSSEVCFSSSDGRSEGEV